MQVCIWSYGHVFIDQSSVTQNLQESSVGSQHVTWMQRQEGYVPLEWERQDTLPIWWESPVLWRPNQNDLVWQLSSHTSEAMRPPWIGPIEIPNMRSRDRSGNTPWYLLAYLKRAIQLIYLRPPLPAIVCLPLYFWNIFASFAQRDQDRVMHLFKSMVRWITTLTGMVMCYESAPTM